MFETNEEKKLELMRELMCEFIPTTLGRLESRLQERGGQFFVGNNLTWADLHAFSFLDRMRLDNAEVILGQRNGANIVTFYVFFQLLDDFPAIKSLIERIEELPNISRWLQSRPSTLM